jgi:uncharacterized protein YjiS (DUF1127 family)
MAANVVQVRPEAAAVRPRRGAAGFFARLVAAIVEVDRIQRERHYLAEMDERLLRDIGITRADVEAEMRRPVDWAALLFRG